MSYPDNDRAEQERRRWMRGNAHLYVRPDAERFIRHDEYRFLRPDSPGWVHPDAKLFDPVFRYRKAGFDPNQPRVSAGHSDGGQWTSGGPGGADDPRILSDVTPDKEWKPGARYASRRRGSTQVFINGRRMEATPAQAARLAIAEARSRNALSKVRELDPNWRPTPSSYESVEGLIRSYDAAARQAQDRAGELARVGIGPGPFTGESIPARGPKRNYSAWERSEGRRIFSETGCHTCGTRDPGTVSGNPVLDHQLPSALNLFGRPQRLYPQCLTCSLRQGNWIMRYRGGRQ